MDWLGFGISGFFAVGYLGSEKRRKSVGRAKSFPSKSRFVGVDLGVGGGWSVGVGGGVCYVKCG